MEVLVVLAHPDEKSFNHAIAGTVVRQLEASKHIVRFHDLYAENFDPMLPADEIKDDAVLPPAIQEHCEQLIRADGLVIIHPNWWGQPPAIMKGWIDRIFRPKQAYLFQEDDQGEGIPQGLLKAKQAYVINTSNTPEERELNVFGDPLQALWKKCILDFCGIRKFARKMFRVIVTSSHKQRERWLAEVAEDVQRLFPVNSE